MTPHKKYDYIIVGTGPGGGTVAKEISDGKRSLLMVEFGPRLDKTGFMKTARKAFMGKDKQPLRSDGDVWIGRALWGICYKCKKEIPILSWQTISLLSI
jgi:choline dehydrogenase-like flavoprotein